MRALLCCVVLLLVGVVLGLPHLSVADTPAEAFAETEVVEDGLGPRFNLDSCGGCHAWPSLGGSSPPINPQVELATALGARNTIPSFLSQTGPIREVRFPSDGQVHQLFVIRDRADLPVTHPACALKQPDFEKEVRRGNVVFRIPTPLFGAGAVEAIPDGAILAQRAAVAARAAPLGIQGTVSVVGALVGRFGWKAQHADLAAFSAEAYLVEMGITSPEQPTELETQPHCQFAPVPNNGDGDVQRFTAFMRALAPPPPAAPHAGRTVFDDVGCGLCHTPTLGGVPLYSDLLLHAMGALGDGIPQGTATGAQFRTAPLWGVGQRLFLLHDGRTADLTTAIAAHGSAQSEAAQVVARFRGLSATDREALLAFLRGL